MSSFVRRLRIGLVAVIVGCAREPLPERPAAVIEIDTDLPVPSVLSRLQVDVFDEGGAWVQTRRFALTREQDWPTSFGVALGDPNRETTLLVRLRGYVDGAEQDYRGERFFERRPYVPFAPPPSLAELCANAPPLAPKEVLVQRVGPKPLFPKTCGDFPNQVGSVAARVTIPAKGRYRFAALRAASTAFDGTYAAGPAIHLVTECRAPLKTLACAIEPPGSPSVVDADLDPGEYTMVTSDPFIDDVGLVALTWGPATGWVTPAVPPPPIAGTEDAPRLALLQEGFDITPTVEPAPDATVDRLLRVKLRPGAPYHARVVLRGACAGTPSKLVVRAGKVVADESMTCADDPNALVTAPTEDPSAPHAASEVGTFAADSCAAGESDDQRVCVPGGAFVLGGGVAPLAGFVAEGPRRIVAVKSFLIDKHEYTVRRYRAALGAGLSLPSQIAPLASDDPNNSELELARDSTYSLVPGKKEDFPLVPMRWEAARRACAREGGDLPTEAQWERAASYGHGVKHTYPWGDEDPTCDRVIAGREGNPRECSDSGIVAATSPAMARDTSALGIVGLGGNAAELTLGAARRYDDACFRGAAVIDPVCLDPSDAARVTRGGSFRYPLALARVPARRSIPVRAHRTDVGFRCAYPRAK